jgi:tRNA nucleotidyltransferase (CCA-adding enzyme)
LTTLEVLCKLNRETKAEVYIVGGFVRDYLRKKKNTDLDTVVRGLSLRNIKKFLKRYGSTKEIKISKTNESIETNILLFRAENDTIEAQISLPRRGKKQIADSHNTLRQDVLFRDFKVNSMYLPIDFKSSKDVIDLVGGREDINNRRITANGSAIERFKESPIRMMRAISLSSRTGYSLELELVDAIKKCSSLITKCPFEAIRKEFNIILMSKKPSKYIRLLAKVGLLKTIAPEIYRCIGVKQDGRYHKFDVFTHLIYTVDNCERDLTLRLAGLLHDVGKPSTRHEQVIGNRVKVTFHKHEMVGLKIAKEFLKRMKYDNETIKNVTTLVKFHMFHFTRDWTDSTIRKFIRKVDIPEEYLSEDAISSFPLFKLRSAERLGNGLKSLAITDRQKDFEKKLIQVYNESNGLKVTDLKLRGNDLISEFKLKEGEKIGEVQRYLLDKILDNPSLNNREDLIYLANEYISNNN